MTLPPTTCDDAIRELFSAIDRSLIQYLDQASPWTGVEHAQAIRLLDRLAAGQRQSAAESADLLSRRHLLPEGISFPSEFTRLHYVSLDFAMDRLIANQIGVVAAAAAALLACARHSFARSLQRVHVREADHLTELRRLRDLLQNRSTSGP